MQINFEILIYYSAITEVILGKKTKYHGRFYYLKTGRYYHVLRGCIKWPVFERFKKCCRFCLNVFSLGAKYSVRSNDVTWCQSLGFFFFSSTIGELWLKAA